MEEQTKRMKDMADKHEKELQKQRSEMEVLQQRRQKEFDAKIKRIQEDSRKQAEKYKKEILKEAFWGWRIFLRPLAPFVRYMDRKTKA